MSTSRTRRGGSGGRQFAVGGRWRHVAVVDTGCGCRPRRLRLPLMSLPSFLRPSAPKPPAPGSSISSRSSSFFPSSASTASSATYSSYSSSSNYANVPYKQNQAPAVPYGVTAKASAPAPVARKKAASGGKARKRREKTAEKVEEENDDGVGVAVEKESSDPRADFQDSMVQMVVEMGLCDWDGLRSMLRRLLALNAPRHHAAILAAFAEVCAQLASEPPPQPPAYHYDYYY